LASPDGETFQYAIKLDFVTTNNEAEYEALLSGLSIAREMGARNVEIRSDSQVVISHVQGLAEAQGEKMIQYLDKVRKCQSNFDRTAVTQVPRKENARADALSKMGSGTGPVVKTSTRGVVIQTKPSILPKLDMMEIEEESDEPEWATDVIQYLHNGSLPEEKMRARKVKMHSARYVLIGGSLYRRGYTEPLLKCLKSSEAEYILKEIHEGVCGNHSGSRMLAHKAIRAGYYWPTMNKDSVKLVRKCDKCQRFARVMKQPPEKLSPITSPWPFAKWGVDIVEPMPPGKGGRKFLLVAVDYFTKWAEAEALATITTANVVKFLWTSIICRFGIPHAFVTDNGKQFDCEPFRKWCAELRIRNYYSTPIYPPANGQVEATNKTLLRTLKKKLGRKKGAWAEYVPEVLWAYRTTTRTPTGATPFSLTYGSEAIIPAEVRSPSFRVSHYNPGLNDEGIKLNLDLLQERRDEAQVTWAAYQDRAARYFNKKLSPRKFQLGDWVLRKVSPITKDPIEGKLGVKWEGPYRVIRCHDKGAYDLIDTTGKELPRAWNAENLKKYFL
jgi:ribonuclease HI